jgi:hypothetical protein
VKFYGGIYPSSRNSLKIHEQAADVLRFTKKEIAVANFAGLQVYKNIQWYWYDRNLGSKISILGMR